MRCASRPLFRLVLPSKAQFRCHDIISPSLFCQPHSAQFPPANNLVYRTNVSRAPCTFVSACIRDRGRQQSAHQKLWLVRPWTQCGKIATITATCGRDPQARHAMHGAPMTSQDNMMSRSLSVCSLRYQKTVKMRSCHSSHAG